MTINTILLPVFWSGCCAAFSRVCPRGRGWRRLHPGHKKRFYILRFTATFIMTDKFTFIYIDGRRTFYAHIHVMRDGNILTLLVPLPIVNRSTPSRRSSYSISRLDRVAADDQQQQFVSAVSSLFRNHHGHRHRVVPRERVIVAADAMHELHRPSRASAWHQSIVIVDARVVVHHHVISIRARAIIAESASASCRAEPKYFCAKNVFLLTT